MGLKSFWQSGKYIAASDLGMHCLVWPICSSTVDYFGKISILDCKIVDSRYLELAYLE